jgi:hypothetical protein
MAGQGGLELFPMTYIPMDVGAWVWPIASGKYTCLRGGDLVARLLIHAACTCISCPSHLSQGFPKPHWHGRFAQITVRALTSHTPTHPLRLPRISPTARCLERVRFGCTVWEAVSPQRRAPRIGRGAA